MKLGRRELFTEAMVLRIALLYFEKAEAVDEQNLIVMTHFSFRAVLRLIVLS